MEDQSNYFKFYSNHINHLSIKFLKNYISKNQVITVYLRHVIRNNIHVQLVVGQIQLIFKSGLIVLNAPKDFTVLKVHRNRVGYVRLVIIVRQVLFVFFFLYEVVLTVMKKCFGNRWFHFISPRLNFKPNYHSSVQNIF